MASTSAESWENKFAQNETRKKINCSFLQREILKDKLTTIKWLQEHRLIHSSPACSKCGQIMKLEAITGAKAPSDGYRWRCRDRGSNPHQTTQSIRKYSWFDNSNRTIAQLLQFAYWWSTNATQDVIEHELSISSATCVDWCKFAIEVCEENVIKHSEPIGGPGIVVEIDEAEFCKKKYHRGCTQVGQWVIGGRERDQRDKIFLAPVAIRDEQIILPLIKKWILPGSIIHSNWKFYSKLEEMGYKHSTVNNSVEFTNQDTGACTSHIKNEWLYAKKGLSANGATHKHIQGYLAEHLWRTKVKSQDKDPFLEFLHAASEVYDVHNPSLNFSV